MPTPGSNVGSDFAAVLSSAQERPIGDQNGRDLPDGFPLPQNDSHKVVDMGDPDPKAIPGQVRYSYKLHRRVFTIYRPWEQCNRCKDEIANNIVVIPSKGDYECPHNNKDEYEAIMNDILAARLTQGSEQEIVQRDGTIVISLRWYERVLTKQQLRAIQKAKALASMPERSE